MTPRNLLALLILAPLVGCFATDPDLSSAPALRLVPCGGAMTCDRDRIAVAPAPGFVWDRFYSELRDPGTDRIRLIDEPITGAVETTILVEPERGVFATVTIPVDDSGNGSGREARFYFQATRDAGYRLEPTAAIETGGAWSSRIQFRVSLYDQTDREIDIEAIHDAVLDAGELTLHDGPGPVFVRPGAAGALQAGHFYELAVRCFAFSEIEPAPPGFEAELRCDTLLAIESSHGEAWPGIYLGGIAK